MRTKAEVQAEFDVVNRQYVEAKKEERLHSALAGEAAKKSDELFVKMSKLSNEFDEIKYAENPQLLEEKRQLEALQHMRVALNNERYPEGYDERT